MPLKRILALVKTESLKNACGNAFPFTVANANDFTIGDRQSMGDRSICNTNGDYVIYTHYEVAFKKIETIINTNSAEDNLLKYVFENSCIPARRCY